MKKYNLEISEDEFNLIRLALSAAAKEFRTTRVKYTSEELKEFLEGDGDFEPFAEQQQAIRDFNKRLNELKES
jgi:hypothetical protein